MNKVSWAQAVVSVATLVTATIIMIFVPSHRDIAAVMLGGSIAAGVGSIKTARNGDK